MKFIVEINNIEEIQISMLHRRLIDFLNKDSEENTVYYAYKIIKELSPSNNQTKKVKE